MQSKGKFLAPKTGGFYDVEAETSLSRDPRDLEPERNDVMFASTAP